MIKVKSYFKKLFTVHCSLFTAKAGFTLIEIVMIIVIVSIAIPALLIVLGQGTRQSVDAELQVSATNVAQALMEEIKTECWDETHIVAGSCTGTGTGSSLGIDLVPPGETTGNPTTYDDVDDYIAGVPDASVGGVTYTRTVQVCYVPDTNLNSTSPCVTASGSATDYKRIQVTVSNTTFGSVELVTLVGNY